MNRIVLALLVFLLPAPVFAAPLAIVGAKIYSSPNAAAISDGTILIDKGKIVAVGETAHVKIPEGASHIDAQGLVAVAGFWNSHVHILTHDLLHADTKPPAELSAIMQTMFTSWGFTTVFDVASVLDNTNAIRIQIASGQVTGPQILTVGEPFYPAHGTPAYVRAFFAQEHLPSDEITTIPAALARVDDEIQMGADGIKLFIGAIVGDDVGVLIMPKDQASALAAEAHKLHRPVFAHPSNLEGVETSIESGVDVLAHTAPMAGPWSNQLIRRMRAHHMALIPTLALFEVEAKKFGESPEDEKNDLAAAEQQLGAYWRAGGQILFGTDVGYTDAYDTTEEFRLMREAGLEWRAILASLTTNPADRFGYEKRKGRLAPGMDADIVLLDGDPAADVTAYARVDRVFRAGAVIYAK
ncbi:MAG TPA: amidohydrolase family protein [Parvularculaceae bacterium]|nr:amidohydrolase family protein [Parvularculaceae bacterium]